MREVIANRLRSDSRKSTGFNTSRVVLRSLFATSPWGIAHWDEAPENLWLSIEQFGLLSRLLVASVTDGSQTEEKAYISEFVRGNCTQLGDAYLKLRAVPIELAEDTKAIDDGALASKVLSVVCFEESIRLAVSSLTLQCSPEINCDIIHQLLQTTSSSRVPSTFHARCCGLWSVTVGFAVFGLPYQLLFEIYDQQILTSDRSDASVLVEIFMSISMSAKLIEIRRSAPFVAGNVGATETAALRTFQWCFSRYAILRLVPCNFE